MSERGSVIENKHLGMCVNVNVKLSLLRYKGERRFGSTHSNLGASSGNCQMHTPAALSSEKQLLGNTERQAGWVPERVRALWRGETYFEIC
jgi:hypothetical protein